MAESTYSPKPIPFTIIVAVSWCMFFLQAVGIYRFRLQRGLLIIQKRYPRFVILEAIVSCIMLLIMYPANSTLWFDFPHICFQQWLWIIIIAGITQCTLHITVIIEACRIWLISYDLQYLHSSKNQQWKTQIDVSYAEKDWYLQNKGKWGNRKYVAQLGFAYYIVTGTAALTSYLLTKLVNSSLMDLLTFSSLLMSFIPPIFILFYLYIKTPRKLQDRFLFQYEFKWTAIILMTILSMTVILIPLGLYFSDHKELIFMIIWCITVFGHTPSLLSTLLITYKVSKLQEWGKVQPLSSAATEMAGSYCSFREQLQETLNDEHKCEAFVDWMYREFSSEAILSFLEFVQFKKYVMEVIGETDENNTSAETDPFNFELYDGMPRSTIIYDTWTVEDSDNGVGVSRSDALSLSAVVGSGSSVTEDPLRRAKSINHLLFAKYIDYHAELEINISGRLRDTFVHLDQANYEGLELEQFVTVYDELISEMMKYQADSYRRFERAYQEYAESHPRSLME